MKVFTSVFDDADLLPHFLQHTIQNGYTQIIIGLSQAPGAVSAEEVDAHCKAIRSTNIAVTVEAHGDPDTPRDAEGDARWMARARAFWCGPDEWHGIAALDEHHDYPGGLFDTVARAEDMGAGYVGGYLVDQVAADGSLPPVPSLPTTLRETFPASRRISGAILGANTSKVCLVRGHIPVGGGHHFAQGGRPSPDAIPVLHYKWHAGVLPRLRRRLDEHNLQGTPLSVESERALSSLAASHGFDMQDARLLF